MIITRISGGLGNQMFQYAIAKTMAKNNSDIFKVDLSFYLKQTLRKYELNLFNINENIATEYEVRRYRGKEDFIFKIKTKLKLHISRPSFYILEKKLTLFDREIYAKNDHIYLDGFWQNEKYFMDMRDEIIQDFTLKNTISKDAKVYLAVIEQINSVSLHVRRGDYVEDSHTNHTHGTCNLDYYKNAINYISSKIEKPKFYIFSDDIAWCKENFDFLENKTFVDNTKNALDDLELMKQCKHNIIANSTFSWWGAWLNLNTNKIVITPKIWFTSNPNLHLASEEWIKI
ncbi:MAG: alpha-1,2-fucosyltransferase [Sulfurovum sp.]|nr:alpha-1,2-fucosyltransferase [Sulfurovum sp.]